ncbi:NAD(P)H-hydrate dehydratase [Neisseriaceae bacterium TC5R-5]|nr:NAD(P)H-hydrate dehydratase [Neisseriaceae bacterium TC5R-5]
MSAHLDRILSLSALRQLEQDAAAAAYQLMQTAGLATADWVDRQLPQHAMLLICAGPGNNGGDALYAAQELLRRGFRVDILLPAQMSSPDGLLALQALQQAQANILQELPANYPCPDLLIDGLFGVGLSRSFAPQWVSLIAQLNKLGCPILALDCPSGLDAYTGVAANAVIQASNTLTFLCQKPGLYSAAGADLAGQVELATLDYPPPCFPAAEGCLNHVNPAVLARRHNSHKGSFGSVCVLGGAPGMLGAALLSGRSALYGGAGKVYVCPLDDRLAVDPTTPELMITSLNDSTPMPQADVYVCGPGMGQQAQARQLLAQVLQRPQPLLLDADALNLLANDQAIASSLTQRTAATILTPHPAEAARLLGISTEQVQTDRIQAARRLAAHYRCVVVLKGAGSLIVTPAGYYHLNISGGPALATAGQGDVLSGLIAALLAQGMDAFDAASLAVELHGLAGNEYETASGGPIGLFASDTARRASVILNRLLQKCSVTKPSGAN